MPFFVDVVRLLRVIIFSNYTCSTLFNFVTVVAGPSNVPTRGRTLPILWSGVIEWIRHDEDPIQIKTFLPCDVTTLLTSRNDLKPDTWPKSLTMRLLNKEGIKPLRHQCLKDTKSMVFLIKPCVARDELAIIMSGEKIGVVIFPPSESPNCHIKVALLFYSPEKNHYLGVIPDDQRLFVRKFKELARYLKQIRNIK